MTFEQAETLLARHFYYRQHPGANMDVPPPAEAVQKIKADYASTIAFLIGVLGTRGRWLRLLVDNKGLPKPDSELRTCGVPLPGASSHRLPRVVLPASPLPVRSCAGGRLLTAFFLRARFPSPPRRHAALAAASRPAAVRGAPAAQRRGPQRAGAAAGRR